MQTSKRVSPIRRFGKAVKRDAQLEKGVAKEAGKQLRGALRRMKGKD